jgi:hypothetical protein
MKKLERSNNFNIYIYMNMYSQITIVLSKLKNKQISKYYKITDNFFKYKRIP